MNKKELMIFGFFSIIILFFLFRTAMQEPEIIVIEQPAPPVIAPVEPLPPPVPEVPPEIPEVIPPPLPELPPKPAGPTQADLTPMYLEFYVNRIYVPEAFPHYIPIKEDRIRTFSGKFGPYTEDMRDHLYVELCSHMRDYPESYACEKVTDLSFVDNFIGFVRGYPEDEYIATVAMRNFGAYYVVVSTDHGPISKSNIAPIRFIRD